MCHPLGMSDPGERLGFNLVHKKSPHRIIRGGGGLGGSKVGWVGPKLGGWVLSKIPPPPLINEACFRFLASKALHRTPRHAEHFSFSQFQPWMLIILTRTQLVLLSVSNVLGAVLCLPRLRLPQGLQPPAKPPAKPPPKAAKPCAKPSTKSEAKPAAQVAAKSAAGEPIPVATNEHVQLFRVKYSRWKQWRTEPVSE